MNPKKDFSRSVLKGLKEKNILLLGSTWLPDRQGDFTNGETGYRVNDNGTSKIFTYLQVLEATK